MSSSTLQRTFSWPLWSIKSLLKSRYQSKPPPTPAILIVGLPSSGKSTFISHLIPSNSPTSTSILSTITKVNVYPTDLPNGKSVLLADTPGFPTTAVSLCSTFREIASSVCAIHHRYQNRVHWLGAIYMHDIHNMHMEGAASQGIRLLEKLVGPENFPCVRVVTTKWTDEHLDSLQTRSERDLEENEQCFGTLIEQGARMQRWDGSAASAARIVEGLVNSYEPTGPDFDVLKEVLDKGKTLAQTVVGEFLLAELDANRQKLKRRLGSIDCWLWEDTNRESVLEDGRDFFFAWKMDLENEMKEIVQGRETLNIGLRKMLCMSGEEKRRRVARTSRLQGVRFDWWRHTF